jgi:AraC-like DNA-binding protein
VLRTHDQIRAGAPDSRLVSSGADHVVVAGGGISYRAPWHWHDCLMILLPSRGALDFRDETRRSGIWLSEEQLVVVPKSQAHETHGSRRGSHNHLALYLTDELLARIETQVGTLARLRRQTRPSIFAGTAEIRTLQFLCCAGDGSDAVTRASRAHLVTALFLQILSQIERTDPLPNASGGNHGHAVIAEMRLFIEAHLAENLPLDVISQTFGLSRRHTTRLFRQWTGYSIAAYQERLRIGAARKLLCETTLPVGEIAWRVGLESGSALARAMKRVAGQSPSDVRRHANA